MRAATCAVVLALAVSLAACGDHSGSAARADGPASAVTRLVVTTDNGLRLRPAGGDDVSVDRRVGHHWSHRDGTWVLDLSCGSDCPRMPRIGVPHDTAVTVVARNAGIDAAGVPGALDLTTVNGDVTVADSGAADAPARLVTRNSSVRATQLRARSVSAGTVNGDLTLDCATAPRRVTARTVNGSVSTVVPHGAAPYRVTATTDNGRPYVMVPTTGAPADRALHLTTVNGDVRARRN
ncbi:DUF4097 family beta strand repeat-containing protein [Streptomyces sp. VRA16 Mangrove soil]|uniref:DUF4097 family beta strand repeat-containing protein n=1 Tax=Streptomyces sp. VRA16 Mangrove soil TaxID=2817434 RepID=UPI001A9FC353|nr:DUF4097 family beta strand repeat-containing protein [Streptomyces sp. VRA16 Mangrove soil]MBO1331439.1 DUF4097 family beta strand repeat protein [Streptomyces sp. VRA16 Mangrove soil]